MLCTYILCGVIRVYRRESVAETDKPSVVNILGLGLRDYIRIAAGVCRIFPKIQVVQDNHRFRGVHPIACADRITGFVVFPNPAGLGHPFQLLNKRIPALDVSAPMRFCSFSPNRICQKMAGNGVQPLHNYTCRFRPSSLKQADKSGLDGLQTGKSDSG